MFNISLKRLLHLSLPVILCSAFSSAFAAHYKVVIQLDNTSGKVPIMLSNNRDSSTTTVAVGESEKYEMKLNAPDYELFKNPKKHYDVKIYIVNADDPTTLYCEVAGKITVGRPWTEGGKVEGGGGLGIEQTQNGNGAGIGVCASEGDMNDPDKQSGMEVSVVPAPSKPNGSSDADDDDSPDSDSTN